MGKHSSSANNNTHDIIKTQEEDIISKLPNELLIQIVSHSSSANKNTHDIFKTQEEEEEEEEEEDIISKLPDELLIQILSLLPYADAFRTRNLSNRWKHLWVYLPNLHFANRNLQAKKFHDSVDQTLALRGGLPIQSFFLECSNTHCNYQRIRNCLHTVVQCKVEKLNLTFRYGDGVKFCWDLFKTCNTLIELTLKCEFDVLHGPKTDHLRFPCLKKMNLVVEKYSSEKSLTNLISGCPVLEELSLDGLTFYYFDVNLFSPSLKRLRIMGSGIQFGVLVIGAPNLEYIYIQDYSYRKYSLMNPMSIVEAHISIKTYSKMDAEAYVQLLACVSFAKRLTLTRESLCDFDYVNGLNLPMFPNLVKLVISLEEDLMISLLKNMPNLEYLTISHELPISRRKYYPLMVEAPDCLRFKMKEIIILTQEVEKQVNLIRYMLKHSNILEKLTIHTHEKFYPERLRQLLNIHPSSRSCNIEFVETSPISRC